MVPKFEMSTYFYSNVIWLESGPKMSTLVLSENSTTKNHIEFDRTPSQQTALQLAAEANLAEVCSILLSEGIDFSAMDSR